jgi:hypothetical protein
MEVLSEEAICSTKRIEPMMQLIRLGYTLIFLLSLAMKSWLVYKLALRQMPKVY